ncbi:M56 family metallopeptidase [Terriglobus albidus]|uniref:M56 family metallopeptidase n=1 Tax=Terriglobus albidus TaxID=1592106 RepID=UPI0021E0F35E|nr:M56 family metallopeptidase [Terriglobus albidus]
MTASLSFLKLSSLLATTWVASLWEGAAFSLIGFALLRLMPRASATLRHTLLLALFLLSAILPWLPLGHSEANGVTAHALMLSQWLAATIASIWLVATAIRATLLVIAWKHLRDVRRSAQPLALDLPLATRRRTVVGTSSAVESPLIVGFFRPVLLLPEWLVPQLSVGELRQIVVHECEHLRRGDDWTNLLLQIGLMLFPLNPALTWLNRHIGVQRELSCDAAVVAATAQPLAYAASLTRIAEQHLERNSLRLALAAWGRRSELAQRVHALLKQSKNWTTRQSAIASIASAVVLLAIAAGFSRVPQLVAVATPVSEVAAANLPTAPTLPSVMPVRFVPASFTTDTPEPAIHKHSRKHAPLKQTSTPEPGRDSIKIKRAEMQRVEHAPTFLRTTAETDTTPLQNSDGSIRTPEHTAPAVVLTPAWLAVPVPDGWLVIQL